MHGNAGLTVGRQSSPVWTHGLIATVLAAVVNVALYGIGRALGVPFEVPDFRQPEVMQSISAAAVATTTIIPLVFGTAAAAVIAPRVRNGLFKLQVLTVIVTILSLGAPMNAPAGATVLWLATMHVVAGAALVLGLQHTKKGDQR